jgi:dGTPase
MTTSNIFYKDSDFNRLLSESSEKKDDHRHPVRVDYCRVIHAPSFRRLQGKTQLFPGTESDFFRNRLTHSIEVAQIAKDIALRINYKYKLMDKYSGEINADICEIAGLVHDIGHPPFGHNGEKALDDCMKEYGGFEGNAQTLQILMKTEKKIKDENGRRYGLNLTSRVLASTLKYDNIISLQRSKGEGLIKGYYEHFSEDINKIKDNILEFDKNIKIFKTIECQIMDIADDIAYSTYDIEDALKARFLTPQSILSMDDNKIEKIVKIINQNKKVQLYKEKVRDICYGFFLVYLRLFLKMCQK